jgi:putative ABC transport system permease protein
MIQAEPGADLQALARRIGDELGDAPLLVRPLAEAVEADRAYQTTQRPIGLIFGMGVLIGALVGIVIVYQILSSDVADHLREYATFKAMGYRHRFFLGVVFEEALVLGVLGFLPGVLIAMLIYGFMASATGLPVAMGIDRAIGVFLGTILACTFSGFVAARRLRAADPADLF